MRPCWLIAAALLIYHAALPSNADAQYRCAVAVEIKEKAVLQGQIRDVERPPTDQLWELLRTLSFSPTKEGRELPDLNAVEQATLKGKLRVAVNGAGDVELTELHLVRNKFNNSAW